MTGRRIALVCAVGAAGLVCAGLGVGVFRANAASACAAVPVEDLSLREIGQLRRTVERYKRNRRPVPLALTGREASFLLQEGLKLPAWLGIEGSTVEVLASVPTDRPDRCWNLTFRGRVELERGVVRVQPAELTVGTLGLTSLVGGGAFALPVGALGPDVAANVATLQVADGTMFIRVDRGWLP